MTIVLRIAAAVLLALWGVGQAAAEDASRWEQGFHSRVRLISGGAGLAGVEIVLDKGFKTYWRQPGDSGLPPRFDWAGSVNLAGADVHWPAPSRTEDAGGVAYSYSDRVVFPLKVRPLDPGKPTKLRLTIEYGVCKDICIPAKATLNMALTGSSQHRAAIDEALARVPRPQALAAEGPLSILSVEAAPGEKPSYRVRVRAPSDAALFAEGPENWYVSTSPQSGDGFTMAIEERPREAGPPTILLTLVAGEQAIETPVHLDGELRPR